MCASVYWSCVRRLSLSHALRSYSRRKTGLQRSCSSICQAWHRSKLEVLWTSWTQCQLTTLRRRLTETSLQRCVPLAISLTSLYSLMTDNSQMTIFVYLCELPNTFDTSFLVVVISEWGFYELRTSISVLPNQLSAQVLALRNTNLIESRHVTYVADKCWQVCGLWCAGWTTEQVESRSRDICAVDRSRRRALWEEMTLGGVSWRLPLRLWLYRDNASFIARSDSRHHRHRHHHLHHHILKNIADWGYTFWEKF